MDNRRSPRGLEGVMQGEAPGNPDRPQSLAQGRISCPFSGCSGAFSHDTSPGMQGRAMPFPVQSTLSWTKSCSGCGGILQGRGISAAFFLQTVPQAVLPRIVGETTKTRSLDCLQGLGSAHERQQSAEEDSENTSLPVLLRDDTICGVDGIVRVRREGIARMAQHYACSLKSAMVLLGTTSGPRDSTAMPVSSAPGKWRACSKAGCSSQVAVPLAIMLPLFRRALA